MMPVAPPKTPANQLLADNYFRRMALAVLTAILLALVVVWVFFAVHKLFEFYVGALVAAIALSYPLRAARVFLQQKHAEVAALPAGWTAVSGFLSVLSPIDLDHGDVTVGCVFVLAFAALRQIVGTSTLVLALGGCVLLGGLVLFIFGGSVLTIALYNNSCNQCRKSLLSRWQSWVSSNEHPPSSPLPPPTTAIPRTMATPNLRRRVIATPMTGVASIVDTPESVAINHHSITSPPLKRRRSTSEMLFHAVQTIMSVEDLHDDARRVAEERFSNSCTTILLLLVGGFLATITTGVFAWAAVNETASAVSWGQSQASEWIQSHGLSDAMKMAVDKLDLHFSEAMTNFTSSGGAQSGPLHDASLMFEAVGFNVSQILLNRRPPSVSDQEGPTLGATPLTSGVQSALSFLDGINVTEGVEQLASLDLASLAQSAARTGQDIVQRTLLLIVAVFSLSLDFTFQTIAFLVMLFYFVSANQPPLNTLLGILPVSSHKIGLLQRDLSIKIEAVAVFPFKRALSHAAVVFVGLTIASLPGAHFAAVSAFLAPFIPILPPLVFWVPWVAIAFGLGPSVVGAGILLGAILTVTSIIDAQLSRQALHSKTVDSGLSDYLMTLAVGMGFVVYGISGTILGPLLVIFAQLLYEITTAMGDIGSSRRRSKRPKTPSEVPRSVEAERVTSFRIRRPGQDAPSPSQAVERAFDSDEDTRPRSMHERMFDTVVDE
jgi:predicted PurR-regulated permease PerM